MDRVWNDPIWHQCNLKPIEEWTQIRSIGMNVSRMPEDIIAKIAKDYNPKEGKIQEDP